MAEKNDTVGAKLDAALKIYSNKSASVDELADAVSSLPPVIVTAQGDIEALTARRRETLLSGSDADRLKLKDNIAAAEMRLEQLVAVAEELNARLIQANEAAIAAARARRRSELLGKSDRMAERLRTEYSKAATAIAGLIEEEARLEIEMEDFNKAAPADEALRSPENIVRRRVAEPRKEIRRETVSLWCREDETSPLPAEYQGAVQDQGGGRGALLNRTSQSTPCMLRKFERVEFYAAEPVPYFDPLAQVVNLPGLVSDDPYIWSAAKNQSSPYSWISQAEKLREAASARSAQAAKRRVETSLRLIDDKAQ
jgi:hypothetical protein